MNDREKVLTILVVSFMVCLVITIGALIAKDQENQKYKAIMDVACTKTYNAAHCQTGVDILMNMSPKEIKNYGSFDF